MSTFTKNSVTLKGAVAIAALMAGGTLEFTRIAVGDGNIPEGQTALTMTDLSHHLFDVDINEVYSDSESQATVIGIFNNSQTETGFYYRELGLFAKDPATGAEILFCYGNAGDEAEWISPAGSESVIEKEVHIVTLVGNATEVKATLKSGIYLTQEQAKLKADLDATAAEGGRVVPEQMRFDPDQTLYVDANSTAADADGSEAKPFKTIQAAINARYRGTHVVYIKIKPGTYAENIQTPRAPDTTWRFSKDGDGTVVVGTALIDNAAYAYFNGITFNGPAQTNTPIFQAANTPCVYLNGVTVNGTSNDTGINFSASRGIIVNSQVNSCGIAIASIEGSHILCQSMTGAGNTRGVYASGATVTLSNWGLSATTPYDIVNGGAIHSDGGATTYPSNQGHLYSLGGFTTAESLRTRLGQEFSKLKEGDYKAFQFWNNIIGNFGTFISSQTMHVVLHKTSNDGNGYGIAHFYAHRDAGAAYMQYVNGGFTTETPIPLTKWQTISDGTTNVLDLPTGIYSMVNVSASQNLPTTQGGTLYVDKNLGTQHLMYFVDIEPKIYSRSYYTSGQWGPWVEYTPGIASTSEYGLVRLASESDVLNETDETVMDVPLAYELNDFRRMNKAYAVGDKVNCAFRFEWFLECIQAGTTSNETLDTRNVTFGQEITDGTVKWVVRAHVKSVNSIVPNANGNIQVKNLTSTEIFANTDLNDIKEIGEYFCFIDPTAASLLNCPTQYAFSMTVRKGTILQQEIRDWLGNGRWIRSYYYWSDSNQGWTDWKSETDSIKSVVLNIFFPVGSVYMSADANFNPNTSWGGTWQKIENRFLLGSGTKSVGATGGEENVTLNVNQIPSHQHGVGDINATGYFGNGTGDQFGIFFEATGVFSVSNGGRRWMGTAGNNDRWVTANFNFINNRWGSTDWTGGTNSHNNMPPYEVVSIWKRTS